VVGRFWEGLEEGEAEGDMVAWWMVDAGGWVGAVLG
jgi:hypothetical protein